MAELRRYYQAHPRQRYPNLVCVLTHIDQLRPAREWSPPHDFYNKQHLLKRVLFEQR